jgi:hypothetical protein
MLTKIIDETKKGLSTDYAMLLILLVARLNKAYVFVGVLFSILLHVIEETTHARKWFIVFGVMLVRVFLEWFTPDVLPRWFIAYSTIPLILFGVGENILLYVTSNRRPERLLDLRKAADTIVADSDITGYYAIIYEYYMCVCSVMTIEHHCVTLNDTLYFLCTWVVFTVTEERKLKTYSPLPMRLPSCIVKTIYILYAPTMFWLAMNALAVVNVIMIHAHGPPTKKPGIKPPTTV